MPAEVLLDITEISVAYPKNGSTIPVVDRASFHINRGEFLAIVGESGCGKSQLVLALCGLSPRQAEIRKIINASRVVKMSMIFQEPLSALNPVLTIGEQVREALASPAGKKEDRAAVIDLLSAVGIDDAENRLEQYPHEFSGGMRQRVLIAMALAREPDLLIADEPTTALDVTVQRQILELLKEIQEQRNLTILFITHDLSILPHLAQRIMVMYAGKIIEAGTMDDIIHSPRHPYTQKLLATAQLEKTEEDEFVSIPGTVPIPGEYPAGCRFAPRCTIAREDCSQKEPDWQQDRDHGWACPVTMSDAH
ncbi:MAG: ABC transporter ATP-binding protein [Fidelibacterota bacterium]